MQIIDVVNRMLGTMGEAPLNSLEDTHQLRGACLSTLNRENNRIQAKGWWFNKEDITLTPMVDGRIPIPGDAISVRTQSKKHVQRGRYLYNLDGGTVYFTESVYAMVIRLVKFEELPETAAAYIAVCAVKQFQIAYDGDTTKLQILVNEERVALSEVSRDDTRNSKTNLITSNPRLQRLKFTTLGARRLLRG